VEVRKIMSIEDIPAEKWWKIASHFHPISSYFSPWTFLKCISYINGISLADLAGVPMNEYKMNDSFLG